MAVRKEGTEDLAEPTMPQKAARRRQELITHESFKVIADGVGVENVNVYMLAVGEHEAVTALAGSWMMLVSDYAEADNGMGKCGVFVQGREGGKGEEGC